MTMVMQTISASQFKAKCLALLDEVAESGGEITVTKRGRPVAKVVPIDEAGDSLLGSVTYLVDEEELLKPIDVVWEAAAD